MEDNKIFVPHELKTIEVDVEKKIFRVNGEDFGRNCTGFTISCSAERETDKFLNLSMYVDTGISFTSYDNSGNKTSESFKEKADR